MHVFAKTPTRHHSFPDEEAAGEHWETGNSKRTTKPFFADSEFHWPSFETPLNPGLWSTIRSRGASLRGWFGALFRVHSRSDPMGFVAPDTSWLAQPGLANEPEVSVAVPTQPKQARTATKTKDTAKDTVTSSAAALDAWVLLDANGDCTRINDSFSTMFDLQIQDLMHCPPEQIFAAIHFNCQPLKPFPEFEYLYQNILNSSLNTPDYRCIIEIDWPRKTLVQLSRMTIQSEAISGILFFRDVTRSVMESEKQRRTQIKTDKDLREYFNEVYGLEKQQTN